MATSNLGPDQQDGHDSVQNRKRLLPIEQQRALKAELGFVKVHLDIIARIYRRSGIMLFDLGDPAIKLVQAAVTKNVAHVTTKGSLALPIELWDAIIDFATMRPSNRMCLVKMTKLEETSTEYTLRFQRVVIANDVRLGEIETFDHLNDAIRACIYWSDPRNYPWSPNLLSVSFKLETNATVTVPHMSVSYNKNSSRKLTGCEDLFYNIKPWHIIAKTEGGQCRACNNGRLVCATIADEPSDCDCELKTGYGLSQYWWFSKTVKFCMPLACPQCVGSDIYRDLLQLVRSRRGEIGMDRLHRQLEASCNRWTERLAILGCATSVPVTAEEMATQVVKSWDTQGRSEGEQTQ